MDAQTRIFCLNNKFEYFFIDFKKVPVSYKLNLLFTGSVKYTSIWSSLIWSSCLEVCLRVLGWDH